MVGVALQIRRIPTVFSMSEVNLVERMLHQSDIPMSAARWYIRYTLRPTVVNVCTVLLEAGDLRGQIEVPVTVTYASTNETHDNA